MSQINTEQGQVYQRLASGLRINKSSDDAAGLAIADSLNADARIFTYGVRNLNDGISLLNIADSAIENLSGIVIRLAELAEQSANGTLGSKQRESIDKEAQSLSQEYNRIVQTTKFNNIDLLNGRLGNLNLQAGVGNDAILNVNIGGAIGTGQFGSEVITSGQPSSSRSADQGDLNNDGHLDIVFGTSGAGFFALGDGAGGFASGVSLTGAAGLIGYGIELGDLNGDGNLDILAGGTNAGISQARVWMGDGRGNFSITSTSYTNGAIGGIFQDLSLSDVNADGQLDLITAGAASGAGQIQVRLGNGQGDFGTATSYSTGGTTAYGLTLGDLNNDGVLDLLSSTNNGAGSLSVRLGTGNGTFSATNTTYTMNGTARDIGLADLNNDGKLDVVTIGNTAGAANVFARLGNGDGTFQNSTSVSLTGTDANDLRLRDLNGDGFIDLAIGGNSAIASINLGNGAGGFESNIFTGFLSEAFDLGDFNEDGVYDLVRASPSQLGISAGQTISGTAPLLDFSLKSINSSKEALSMFKIKLNTLAKQRGQIGANQVRVATASNMLTIAKENFQSAESRIRDADIALESSRLIRNNILQQVAGSVVNKANLQPEIALKLLI